jgi:type IV pilus assembly protein PilM
MEKLWTVSAKKKATLYRKNPSEFISCVGAVVNPIDFVPKELIEKKQKRSAIFATVIFTMACIAGSVGTVYVSYTDYLTAQQKLDEVNDQLNALPDVSSIYKDNDKATKELENLQEFEASTSNGNDYISEVIDEYRKSSLPMPKLTRCSFRKTEFL